MNSKRVCKILIGLYLWVTAGAVILSFVLYSKDKTEIIKNSVSAIILLVIPGLILMLPTRKKKTTNNFNPSEFFSDVPKETLKNMRYYYTPMQANNDIRILLDSINIINKTTNLETFISRYELALKKIANLEMAKYAGVRIKLPIRYPEVTNLINRVDNVLDVEYQNELKKINSLKTEKGRSNRINKFLSYLKNYEYMLDENGKYNDIIDSLEECQSEHSNDNADNTTVNTTSDADELRKFKELLDEGIITQEEFEKKKLQILGL